MSMLTTRDRQCQSPISYSYEKESQRTLQTYGFSCSVTDFFDFYWTILDLRVELARSLSKFRIIGLCIDMTTATASVLEHIDSLRDLFGRNARTLFPKEHALEEAYKENPRHTQSELLYQFPEKMNQLDMALQSMDNAFQDYDEIYTDEKVKMAITVIRRELQHDASDVLKRLESGETLSITQTHIHSMLPRLSNRFQFFKKALEDFLLKGISSITSSQKAKTAHFLTLSTIATFFSGVTSTLLQMVYQGPNNWASLSLLVSLAFSVSSALSSVVAVSWYRAMILPPRHAWRKPLLWGFENWPSFAFILSIYGFYSGLLAIYWNLSDTAFNAASLGVQILAYGITSCFTITYVVLRIRIGLAKFRKAPDVVTETTYESFTSGIMDARVDAARRVAREHAGMDPGRPYEQRSQTGDSSLSRPGASEPGIWMQ